MYEPNMSDMFQTQIRWAGMIRIEMNDEKTFSINIVDSKKKNMVWLINEMVFTTIFNLNLVYGHNNVYI